MGAPSRATMKMTTPARKTSPPSPRGQDGGARKAPADAVGTDSARAAIFLGVVALVLRFGEDVSVAALAAPILVVAGVVLLVLILAELRVSRRWSLH